MDTKPSYYTVEIEPNEEGEPTPTPNELEDAILDGLAAAEHLPLPPRPRVRAGHNTVTSVTYRPATTPQHSGSIGITRADGASIDFVYAHISAAEGLASFLGLDLTEEPAGKAPPTEEPAP